MVRVFKIAVCGAGVVGGGVVNLVKRNHAFFRSMNFDFEVKTLLCKDLSKARDFTVEAGTQVTSNPLEVLNDKEIDIVVEVIGGTGSPARDLVLASGRSGKAVVTANKALLADALPELKKVFSSRRRSLGYEASVAGGIPIIRALQHSLLPDSVTHLQGILNGTTNFILSGMAAAGGSGGRSYGEVLREAQKAGFAETDPTADVEGHDARNKLVLLTQLAFGTYIPPTLVRTVGITGITPFDMAAAAAEGYTIKLLGVATLFDAPPAAAAAAAAAGAGAAGAGEEGASTSSSSSSDFPPPRLPRKLLDLFVSPCLVPIASPLGTTGGAGNLVQVDSLALGRTSYDGAGAGREATANSVLADLVAVARGTVSPRPFPRPPPSKAAGFTVKQSLGLRRDMYVRGPARVTDLLSMALWRQGRSFSPCTSAGGGEGGGGAAAAASAAAAGSAPGGEGDFRAFRVDASRGELDILIRRVAAKVAGKAGLGVEGEEALVKQMAVYPIIKE